MLLFQLTGLAPFDLTTSRQSPRNILFQIYGILITMTLAYVTVNTMLMHLDAARGLFNNISGQSTIVTTLQAHLFTAIETLLFTNKQLLIINRIDDLFIEFETNTNHPVQLQRLSRRVSIKCWSVTVVIVCLKCISVSMSYTVEWKYYNRVFISWIVVHIRMIHVMVTVDILEEMLSNLLKLLREPHNGPQSLQMAATIYAKIYTIHKMLNQTVGYSLAFIFLQNLFALIYCLFWLIIHTFMKSSYLYHLSIIIGNNYN